MRRVVVLGGYGNFGARICRALSEDDDLSVVAAGRAAGSALQLDVRSPGFAERLKAASPDLVVHCAGPFQGQDYDVARAALIAGAHYIDLADGRDFVARFAQNVDAKARARGRLAVSGASTLPALSSAVVDDLASRFRRIDEVQIAIAPGHAVSGEKTNGGTVRAEWHLTVDAMSGPEIPALAAILMARKLARGSLAATGAFACMGFLRLADFAPEFARRGIVTAIEERGA